MMTTPTALVVGATIVLATLRVTSAAADPQVRLRIPKFSGEEDIGSPVATVISLNIWRKLIRAKPVAGMSIGGVVVWSEELLPSDTHLAAERALNESFPRSQMTVWGRATKFGGGIVVQTFFSIPPRDTQPDVQPEKWQIAIKLDRTTLSAAVDFPARRYEFPPLVLNPEVVSKFAAMGGNDVFKQRDLKERIGTTGYAEITALKHEGDRAQLRLANGKVGWIKLPELSKTRSYVVDFASGVIRIFRGDYANGESMFTNIINDGGSPPSLVSDALLFRAFAKAKQGKDGSDDTARAISIDEFSQDAIRFHLMAECAAVLRLKGAIQTKQTAQVRARVRRMLEFANAKSFLLAPDDAVLRFALDFGTVMLR